MPEKTLHDKVVDAEMQLVFLQQTASAIHYTDAEEHIDSGWFDGLRVSLEQISSVLIEVLNLGERKLDELQLAQKKASEEKPAIKTPEAQA